MLTITNNVINIYFDAQINKGFKKFSYTSKNGDRPIIRNVRRGTRFKNISNNRTSFLNNGKISFTEGTLKIKYRIS